MCSLRLPDSLHNYGNLELLFLQIKHHCLVVNPYLTPTASSNISALKFRLVFIGGTGFDTSYRLDTHTHLHTPMNACQQDTHIQTCCLQWQTCLSASESYSLISEANIYIFSFNMIQIKLASSYIVDYYYFCVCA